MTKTERRVLERLRKTCTFENYGASNPKVTATVKEETRLYRETWILPLIDALLHERDWQTQQILAQYAKGNW